MRVLHVYSGNLYGGIERVLVSLAARRDLCPALAHEFALCFDGRLSRELEALGAPVRRLGAVRVSRPHSMQRARRALTAHIAAGRFDRVVCHGAWSQGLFGGLARRAGVPLVFWMHDAAAGRHWTERWARRTEPDLAICNSHYTAGMLRSLYDSVPAAVVYAPVDVSPRPLLPDERRAVRAELGTPPDAVVIVQASRMQALKGHQVALEALARLRARAGWVWWVVGGSQRREEAAYLEGLVESARSLGIADRLRWLGERADVPRLFAAADVHCQANIAPEAFGIAYVEALAAGLPVVASNEGGAVEIVDDSCGLLVAPRDAVALAAALERLIVDSAFRATLAANASERARALSDPATQMFRLNEALSEMASIGAVAAQSPGA
jgi:glycosyltransferase involved in cell wall biosynthesis